MWKNYLLIRVEKSRKALAIFSKVASTVDKALNVFNNISY